MSRKTLALVALALTGTLCAGVAQARDHNDIQWSVTIGAPVGVPVYGQPVYNAPVYTQPYPVYSQPAPAYRHHGYTQPTRWDRDGDGIPNRADPVYNPRWDRDGDGVPNRYDRYDRRDNLRHDRDGDGIPNSRDNRDNRSWGR
jgi:hypothetical protein